MGNYVNPGNSGFSGIRNDLYVDKTGLIRLINQTIDTPRRLTCVSRPRRFGKSFAAKMLCAYYDKTCNSAELFHDLDIADDTQYREHLNRYDVIYLDMTGIIGESSITEVIPYIQRNVIRELAEQYEHLKVAEGFMATLANAAEAAGNKFIMIIDEWDAPIREAKAHPDLQKKYLEFLRTLFNNSGMTDKIFAAAYMTGILPIKKDGSQSAISDFLEYSMIKPRQFGEYAGFTEEEVRKLCSDRNRDFQRMKQWYDGYSFRGFEELPAGAGYADIVYLPKKDSVLPVLVIELKWNQSAEGAIAQIKNRRYSEAVKGYGSDILLVGISYDREALPGERKHQCRIERYEGKT